MITDPSGDSAYVSWQNAGDPSGRPGTFEYTGGTGKYAGAKGSMKLHPRDATPTGYDFVYDLL